MIYFFWEYNFSSISVQGSVYILKPTLKLQARLTKDHIPYSPPYLISLLLVNSTKTHHPCRTYTQDNPKQKDFNQLEAIVTEYDKSNIITGWVNKYSSDYQNYHVKNHCK